MQIFKDGLNAQIGLFGVKLFYTKIIFVTHNKVCNLKRNILQYTVLNVTEESSKESVILFVQYENHYLLRKINLKYILTTFGYSCQEN